MSSMLTAKLKKHTYTVLLIQIYCQILVRQVEIPQKTSGNTTKDKQKNISQYFCSFFQGHVKQSLRYNNTQKLNCKCQELDQYCCLICAHLVDYCPSSEFIPHLANFTPGPKNVRNTITIANINIFIGQKILPPEFVPPKNYSPLKMF